MGRRLILDTTALIEFGRGLPLPGRDNDDVVVAAISIAAFARGIHSAHNHHLSEQRQTTLDRLLGRTGNPALLRVLPYTIDTAEHHAALLHHTKASGKPRGAHDLIIAAHARETGRRIVSTDARARFADLPEVLILT